MRWATYDAALGLNGRRRLVRMVLEQDWWLTAPAESAGRERADLLEVSQRYRAEGELGVLAARDLRIDEVMGSESL